MSLGSLNNQLSGVYKTREVSSSTKKTIADNASTTDQVLDLSGSKEQITNEILKQDISSVKAVKIEGKLVSLDKEQLNQLISELKDKCLDPNSQLKENFKFMGFEKFTGIKVVESKLDINDIREIDNNNSNFNQIAKTLEKDTSLFDSRANWKSGGSSLSTLHENKAKEISKKLTDISTLENKIQNSIDKLTLVEPDSPKIAEMKNQLKILKGASDILNLNKEYNQLMAKEGIKEPTKEFLEKVNHLRDRMDNKNMYFDVLLNNVEVKPELKASFSKILKQSENSVQFISDTSELCSNKAFNRLQETMDKPRSFSSVMEQYNAYKKLFSDGKEIRGRAGETNDVQGFIVARNNDLRDDAKFAKKFKEMTSKIVNGEYTDRAVLEKDLKAMFTKPSGKMFISNENAKAVIDRYLALYDLKQKGVDLSKLDQEVRNVNKSLEMNVIEKIQASDNELEAFKAQHFNSFKGFSVSSENSLERLDKKIEQEYNDLSKKIEVYQRNVEERNIYDYSNMATDSKGLINFLEKNLNYDSKVSVRVGVKASAEASLEGYASVGASAEAKIALTVEKRHTQGSVYRVSLDFSASLGLEAKLTEYLSVSASIKLDASVGIGFNKADDIRDFSDKLSEFMTEAAKENGDVEKLNSLVAELGDIISKNMDAQLGASAEAKYESKISGLEDKKDGFSRDSTEYKNGKTIANSYRKTEGEPAKYMDDGEEKEISINVYNSTSAVVNGTLDRTPVKATLETPFPVLKRSKMVVEIDDFDEFITKDKKPSQEMLDNLAEALIKSQPDLDFVGKEALSKHLKDFFENAEDSGAYAKVKPIIDRYKEVSEFLDQARDYSSLVSDRMVPEKGMLKNGKDFASDILGAIQNSCDINLVVDLADNPETGQRELKFAIEAKGNLDIEIGSKKTNKGGNKYIDSSDGILKSKIKTKDPGDDKDETEIKGEASLLGLKAEASAGIKVTAGMEFNVSSTTKSVTLGSIITRESYD
ncbi:MAG: hypothetical protein U0457_17170 [Candidatus Sericytochromatia bacterium]